MDALQGKLFFVWLVATPLACAIGWWLTRRYRRALVALMRAPLTRHGGNGDSTASTVGIAQSTAALPAWLSPALPTARDWRRAEWRLVAWLAGLSLVMAATRAALVQGLWIEGQAWSWPRLATFTLLFAWPVLPVLAALQRWSRVHLVGALMLWFALALAFAMWRSNQDQRLATVAVWLAWEIGPPALAFLLLTLRPTRAAAPWLWPPVALFVIAALAGMDLLTWLAHEQQAMLGALLGWMGSSWTAVGLVIAGFLLASLALAFWPIRAFARLLAAAYAKRRISDLMVLFSAAWVLNLGFDALASGPALLLPLLWIPLALVLMPRLIATQPERAPTLLVLRVFQKDANVSAHGRSKALTDRSAQREGGLIAALFEDVVERWRVIGPTVLIAGTDLVQHTTDAADLFDHLEGRLAARFVHRAADVPARLAGFDWRPDAEARYRVNEAYCHDSAWQVALAALVRKADLVLMDLRGFQAHNAGCRFELATLARAPHVQRVVVLTDERTDLAVAKGDAAAAPARRFVWIALPPGTARRTAARRVRQALAARDGAPAAARATSMV
jgi:hypothetical protein